MTPNLAPPPPIAQRLERIDELLGVSDITRLLLPGFTEVGRRIFDGKPLRFSSGARRHRPLRRRKKARRR